MISFTIRAGADSPRVELNVLAAHFDIHAMTIFVYNNSLCSFDDDLTRVDLNLVVDGSGLN